MSTGRRLASLLVVLLLIGAPGAALSFACAGASCDEPVAVTTEVPFCTLPGSARSLLEAGYYEGRSPEVFGFIAEPGAVAGGYGREGPGAASQWPSPELTPTEVPLWLFGEGVRTGGIQGKPGLEDVAPTLAAIAGFERGNDEVRSGQPIEGAWERGRPRLLVMIVLKGQSAIDAPLFRRGIPEGAAGIASVGSLPTDSAASLTTAGTGGLPSEHGVTGSLLRSDEGGLVEAWSADAETPVIATLGDDLDSKTGQRAVVGMIATDPTDRGLVGGNWYLDGDQDRFRVVRPGAVGKTFAGELRAGGYGQDDVVDLLGVTLEGGQPQMNSQLSDILFTLVDTGSLGSKVSTPTTVAVFGTGEDLRGTPDMSGEEVVSQVESELDAPVVEAAVPGGLFLDREEMTRSEVTAGKVMRAMDAVAVPGTKARVFLDAYPGFSVSFSRYCP